jgi:hypothetical protein
MLNHLPASPCALRSELPVESSCMLLVSVLHSGSLLVFLPLSL